MAEPAARRSLHTGRIIAFIILALLFGLGMAAFFTLQYAASPPAVPVSRGDDPRQFIYMCRQAGNWDLCTLTLGTRAVVNLTNTPHDEGFPSYSADGRAVSYISNADRAAENELTAWNMNADGSDQRRVVSDLRTIMGVIGNGWFDWDFNTGRDRRAFVSLRDLNLEVYFGIRADDGMWRDRSLSRARGIDWFPALDLLTGARVAFSSDRDGNQEIYLIDLGDAPEDDRLHRLTDHPTDDISAAFTQDGRIVFYSERDTTFDGGVTVLYLIDPAQPDAQPERLVPPIDPALRVDAQFAPAGDVLIWMGYDGDDWEIYLEDAAGRIVNLTDNATDDLFPAWR
jgi:Tol biopolymer transport system component